MVKFISSDYILPAVGKPLKDGIVSVDSEGKIVGLFEKGNIDIPDDKIEKHEGIITPGFVNSHCHLELSHLHKKFPMHQGLIPFIERVIGERGFEDKVINQAMVDADKKMYENGIVAVGDVSNNNKSCQIKKNSAIYYHTFVEMLGFSPVGAADILNNGLKLKEEFGKNCSLVPHSAYSVSKELLKQIKKLCETTDNLITIHNQECDAENKFYRYKTGELVEFYKKLDQDISYFKPQARNSVQTVIPIMPDNQRILLVHNTYTSLKDIYFIRRFGRDVTWCFCPNANLYIENRLPKVEMFLNHSFSITLGTDSLASNDNLCVLSELKVISERFPAISLLTSLNWATINGAKFLGIDDKFGSIEPGKRPGLNLITNINNMTLTEDSKVVKLI